MLDYSKSFIEEQFPVSKISKESYKERKSSQGQTITGVGKWWGRKPLVLVRASVIGMLLPVSDSPIKDKEIFLKIMSMDDDGLLRRQEKPLPVSLVYDYLDDEEQEIYFNIVGKKISYSSSLSKEEKANLQKKAFKRMSYDDKLKYCLRPEQIENTDEASWREINEHLETNASNIQELVAQLGEKRFGHVPIVGDCFSGGGSNVFEPARLGCEVKASDLNPIAMTLTWADLNLLNMKNEKGENFSEAFVQRCLDTLEAFYSELDTEEREDGNKVKFFLYCAEVTCPECGTKVPLIPSFVIGQRTSHSYIHMEYREERNGYDIFVHNNEDEAEYKEAAKKATVANASLVCPHCMKSTSLNALRATTMKDWTYDQFMAKDNNLFKDRLYAMLCLDQQGKMYYQTVEEEDLKREEKIISYLTEHYEQWQQKGYIPHSEVESGYNTEQPIRERGWKYWENMFSPRQLLMAGKLSEIVDTLATTPAEYISGILMINRLVDFNSKMSRWNSAVDKSEQTFYNQALNTLLNYGVRGFATLPILLRNKISTLNFESNASVKLCDAREIDYMADLWITDPPYADAVNYHELSEYFLAWDKALLPKAYPEWYTDSKRALAIQGTGTSFNESMVEVYRNLAKHMPDNGMQMVMFTHQDTKVWAELSMILWSAGLKVSAAWCIATEIDAVGIKQGNYVKGTVLMVLRKQTSDETIFKDELYEEIRDAVKSQIDTMKDLDDLTNPDFNDGDYLLAAYVAALKILTSYKNIAGLDVSYELQKARENAQDSPVTQLINVAKKEAYDYLVPTDIASSLWRNLIPEERFYIKGFELELKGNKQMAAFQEIARGFGISDYQSMLASTKANHVRLKSATEYKSLAMGEDVLGQSLLRQILFAVYISARDKDPMAGRNYLKSRYEEKNEYWEYRNTIIDLLGYFGKAAHKENMQEWRKDAEYALMLCEAIKNDSI